MTIEDDENGNAKYIIFALLTCQLPIHIANIKQSHAHNIYCRGENKLFHSFIGQHKHFHRLSNRNE